MKTHKPRKTLRASYRTHELILQLHTHAATLTVTPPTTDSLLSAALEYMLYQLQLAPPPATVAVADTTLPPAGRLATNVLAALPAAKHTKFKPLHI